MTRGATRSVIGALAMLVTGCALLYPTEERASSHVETNGVVDGGGPDVPSSDDGTFCNSDQQCGVDGGAPFACRSFDHTCQPLRTVECPIVYPQRWADPHAVFLGAYAALPERDPENSDLVWDYELAVQEFNEKGGLPDTNGIPHTLVTVVCNSGPTAGSDPDFLVRSLDHLTDVVGVPAIVADLASKDLTAAFQRTRDKGQDVFFMSPGPADNALARLDDDGLVWSMLGLPVDLAPAYKALLRRVEAYARSVDPALGTLRVALVKSGDANEPRHEQLVELLEALTLAGSAAPGPHLLEFNGLDLAANQSAGNYREFVVDATPESPAAVGQRIIDFGPHVVISMAGPAFTRFDTVAKYDGVADTIESRSMDRRYPFFILSPVNASAWTDVAATIGSISQTYADIHRRFVGIDVAMADDPTLYYQYLERLRSSKAHPLAREGTENYYDPIYYLAYAMYRAGVDRRIDGKNVLAGMNATLAGARYDVGPDPISAVLFALHPSQPAVSIQLVGTMGAPNFDPLTGTRVNRAALYCFPAPPSIEVHQQVQVFAGGSWTGTFDCFAGF
jgi:hypothetical protein